MSEVAVIQEAGDYGAGVRTGRPTDQERSPFGQRLHEARINSGISQVQVAEKLSVSQSGYAAWERGRSSPSPEQIEQLAKLFGVPVSSFFGKEKRKAGGPKGRAKLLFEQVSELPRHQQQRILGMVEDMLIAQDAKAS